MFLVLWCIVEVVELKMVAFGGEFRNLGSIHLDYVGNAALCETIRYGL